MWAWANWSGLQRVGVVLLTLLVLWAAGLLAGYALPEARPLSSLVKEFSVWSFETLGTLFTYAGKLFAGIGQMLKTIG